MLTGVAPRRRWKVVATAALALAVVLSSGSAVAAQAAEPPSLAAVDRFVTARMEDNGIPGLAVAITHAGRIIHLQGYGTAGNGTPVTPDTRFRIASLSKSFTALAVLQLVDAGQVDLDAPIRTYLPDFTVATPGAADRITVRHLLNQTSGLADAGFPEAGRHAAGSLAERVASLADARTVSAPGTEFHYFNPNYAVLARLVEVVGGQPFADYLRQQVFAPLDMDSTTTAPRTSAAADLAQGHLIVFGMPVAYDLPDGFVGGSGGVVSTAADLANFLIMQVGNGRFGSREVVSAEAVATMRTPPEGVDSDYAMGWTVRGGEGQPEQVGHTGILSNFYAEQVLLPDTGYGIVLLANAYSALVNFSGITQGLVALVSGAAPEDTWLSARVLAVAFGVLTAGVLVVRTGKLRRVSRWARRHRDQRWRWRILGAVWLLLPAAVLVALPELTSRFAGRAFTYRQLFLSMPDVVVWLGCAAVLGILLLVARSVALLRISNEQWGWD